MQLLFLFPGNRFKGEGSKAIDSYRLHGPGGGGGGGGVGIENMHVNYRIMWLYLLLRHPCVL